MAAVTDGKWSAFNLDDAIAEKYIKALEKKGFIVSTDHEQYIMIRPIGVFKKLENNYLVCLCPHEHFEVVDP